MKHSSIQKYLRIYLKLKIYFMLESPNKAQALSNKLFEEPDKHWPGNKKPGANGKEAADYMSKLIEERGRARGRGESAAAFHILPATTASFQFARSS